MYLGTYHFAGDPDQLADAYDQLMTSFAPEQLLVHVCVKTEDGLVIFDACPTIKDFRAFTTSPDVLSAMQRAGLPTPQIEGLGPVHRAVAPALASS
jgi:hypothetical protein